MGPVKTILLPWDGGQKAIRIPERNLRHEVCFTNLPCLPNLSDAVISSLENPIGCRSLSRLVAGDGKVAILVGDRITDRLIGTRDHVGLVILDHLNRCGVPDQDIALVYAPGMHRSQRAAANLGPELLGRVELIIHDAWEAGQLVYMGVTSHGTPVWINRAVAEADVVLGIGEISPVAPAGFCGGGKIILPGVAGSDTIGHNHRMVMSPRVVLGQTEGNPIREDIEEAAELADLSMKLDILVNSAEEVVGLFCGHFWQEHRAALPLARRIWATPMERTELVISYPGDGRERYLGSSLYLSLQAADLATVEGGVIVMVLSAAGGWGSGWEREPATLSLEELSLRLVRAQGDMRNLANACLVRRVLEAKPVFLVCEGMEPQEARELGFAFYTSSFEEALARALCELGHDATISTIIPRGIQWRMIPWVGELAKQSWDEEVVGTSAGGGEAS